MKSDISRDSFAPEHNFRSVRQQQGRVITDADWNEQADIQNHLRANLVRDSIAGFSGGPASVPAHAAGFRVVPENNSVGQPDLKISAGRAHVNGSIIEKHTAEYFTEQIDSPGAALPQDDGVYLAYLDVFERGIGFREHPAIRDVALGSIEVSSRSRQIAQVRLLPLANGDNADAAFVPAEWNQFIARQPGRLAARTAANGVTIDPCAIGARGGYTGTDNLLYRVEVHASGPAGAATFKWSRDNGAIMTEWLAETGANRLSIRSIGRDSRAAFAPGQWIEIDDEGLELEGRHGTFAHIVRASDEELEIDPDSLVHFDPAITELNIDDFARGVRRIRRWDMIGAIGPRTIAGDGGFHEIEQGIEIQFDADPAREYRTGEAWLIPARALNRNIVWPCESDGSGGASDPLLIPPHETRHAYARLAFLKREAGIWSLLADARRVFASLTHANLFYVGGDGQAILPDLQLRQPLQASVRSGPFAVPAARVRFDILDAGSGTLRAIDDPANAGTTVTVNADGAGVAAVYWQCGSQPDSEHRVQATLLDESAQPVSAATLSFHAHKSDARAVDYAPLAVPDPQGADLMQGVESAQEGLDRLGEIKVNRAGDTISGSLTVDEDLEIKGTLTVRGDVIARDTDHMPGDVLLGDQDEDSITVHGEIKSEHSSGTVRFADAIEIRSPDLADAPLHVFAQIQGVAGRAFRRPITLDYSAGAAALSDYQIALNIDTAALIAAGNLKADAGDLLFLDADESTILPYWMESGLNTAATKIWVRVPEIAAGASRVIYMYYGNAQAVSQSSPAQTFVRVIENVTAAYSMDAGTSASIADASGNGISGTIDGATWTTGRFNNALAFDGQNDFVNLGANPLLFPTGSFSISAWMKSSGPYGFLFSNHWGGEWRGVNLGVWGDGESGPNATNFGLFIGEDTPTSDQLEAPSQYNDDQWRHIVAVYDQANLQLRLYIDGALTAQKTTTIAQIQYGASLSTDAFLGRSSDINGTQYHFTGTIDELKLYGRALDDQDAAALFSNFGYVTPNLPGRELVRRIAADGSEPAASVGGEETLSVDEQSALFVQSQTGNVGIGTETPGERLSVAGIIETTVGGIKFPDGTIQTTAGGPGGGGDSLPLGTIMAWHKDLNGTPPLPSGWVECNGQIVGDPASPYHNQELPDLNNPKESWNAKGSFLRGGSPTGVFEDDRFQGHQHNHDGQVWTDTPGPWRANTNGSVWINNSVFNVRDARTDGVNGEPRTGSETRPVNMTVVWIIKILDTAGTGGSGGGHWSKSGDTIFYNSGKVGVGTSNPNEALTVDGALSLKEQPRLAEGTADHGKLYVRQGGPVSISFDGVDDYIDLSAHAADFGTLTTGTVSMWFRSRTTTLTSGSLFRFGQTTDNNDAIELGIGPWASHIPDETMHLNISGNGTNYINAYLRRGEQFLADQEWHHIALVIGPDYNRLYLNGEEQTLNYEIGGPTTGGVFFAAPIAKELFTLGFRRPSIPGDSPLNGFLDEIAIFDRPLAANEIVSIHEANRTADLAQDFESVFSPNLAAYFRATNFDGSTLSDSSGNGRNGTFNGAFVTPDYPAALVYKDPQGVESVLNGGAGLPLGTIIAWHKNMSGTPALPDGWVECNGQILNDPFSAYNGQTMPDLNNPKESWNAKGSFLRGDTTSGDFEDDAFQGHRHLWTGENEIESSILWVLRQTMTGETLPPGVQAAGGSGLIARNTILGDPAGSPGYSPARIGDETRPVNMSVVWIIKVKEAAPQTSPGPLQYAFLYDRKPFSNGGGAATAGVWNVRDLNIIETNIPGVSLSANRFTLPEGTYLIEATAPAHESGRHRLKLIDSPAGADRLIGNNAYNSTADSTSTHAVLQGVFTIAETSAFEIQHYIQAASNASTDLGVDSNVPGIDEIYTQVKIQRIDAPVPPVADPAPPPDIGFSASGGPHVSNGAAVALNYATIYTNEGEAFDGTTFTAPYAGLYSFSVTFVKDTFDQGGTDDDVWVTIAHNGASKGRATAGQGAGPRDSASYSVVLKLEGGDTVQTNVSSDGGGLQRHLPEYHFQGYRV
ncbi:MAG: DUF2341 domain-containing protein [bacterium]|nr:DUF2341 domain-containing protein [bacterium]